MINAVSGLPPIIINKIETELKNSEKGNNKTKAVNLSYDSKGVVTNNTTVDTEGNKSLNIKKDDEKQNNVNFNKIAKVVESSIGDENLKIEFVKDEEAEQLVMKVIDKESQEVVKQFPPEITLKIAKLVATLLETTGQVTNAKV